MDNQLRVCLGMTLRLGFELLSLGHHLACGLILCSACTGVREVLHSKNLKSTRHNT